MPKSKSKRKAVLQRERDERTQKQRAAPGKDVLTGARALKEIQRLVNLPVTTLTDWPEDLQPPLAHACGEFADQQPVIYRDVDGRPVIIASSPHGLGWVVLDDIRNGEWRLRMFATERDVAAAP